jgi:hypothetical protein
VLFSTNLVTDPRSASKPSNSDRNVEAIISCGKIGSNSSMNNPDGKVVKNLGVLMSRF